MKGTILVDNISDGKCKGEWGLAIFIEYEGKKILLDTGGSNLFLENAKKLNLNIENVDYGVLSHAHYDHSNGLEGFFHENREGKFYIRQGSMENCYSKHWIFKKYIGIKKGTLEKYKERIQFVDGDYTITSGVHLIPHKTDDLDHVGKKSKMYVKKNGKSYYDDFAHEQSLVIETKKGLVIFNSCSHGGVDLIIKEIGNTFKGKHIYAIVGGFHLFRSSDEEVKLLANKIKDTGIDKIYTGHCTGDKGFKILKEELGEKIEQFKVGLVIEV